MMLGCLSGESERSLWGRHRHVRQGSPLPVPQLPALDTGPQAPGRGQGYLPSFLSLGFLTSLPRNPLWHGGQPCEGSLAWDLGQTSQVWSSEAWQELAGSQDPGLTDIRQEGWMGEGTHASSTDSLLAWKCRGVWEERVY